MKNITILIFIITGTIFSHGQNRIIPLKFSNTEIKLIFEKGESWINPALVVNEDSSLAGPHFVIWLEDSLGNIVNTLHITKNVAIGKNILEEEYNKDVLPFWSHKLGKQVPKINSDSIQPSKFSLLVEINSPMDYNEHFTADNMDDKMVLYGGQPSLIYICKIDLSVPKESKMTLLGYGGNEKIVIDLSTITSASNIVKSVEVQVK